MLKKKKKKTFLAFAVALLYFYTKQVPNIQTFSNIQYNTILAMRDNMPVIYCHCEASLSLGKAHKLNLLVVVVVVSETIVDVTECIY